MILSTKIQDAKRLRLANIQEERMVTGALKNKVDKIWTDIWAGGITNPLTVIEQLTYLMFIRSLDEKELSNPRSPWQGIRNAARSRSVAERSGT